MSYQLTSMALGLLLAAAILLLVRRDHLHGPYSLWWIGIAVMVAVLGLFPRLFDAVAAQLGITYPPILAVVLGFSLMLIKMLTMDLDRSRQERLIRRLAQQVAMLEAQAPLSVSTEPVSVSTEPANATPKPDAPAAGLDS